MAIVKKGPAAGWSGKVGNQVYSQQKNGETTVRESPVSSNIPATTKQLAARKVTSLCAKYLKPLKTFVKVGSSAKSLPAGKTPYNLMVSNARAQAIRGKYPDQYVDFSRLLITQGTLFSPQDASVRVTKTGFSFRWNPEIGDEDGHYSDHVMVMAYFPVLKKTRYKTCCAERDKGEYILPLDGIRKGYTAEIYISFITDDHDHISDSVYLGQLTW